MKIFKCWHISLYYSNKKKHISCYHNLFYQKGFLGGSDGKESACNAGDWGSIPGSGRSTGEGNGNPLQYSCLENSMDYSPWGHKELDTTEQLSLSLFLAPAWFVLRCQQFTHQSERATQRKMSSYYYENSSDLADPWKVSQGPKGVCEKQFDNSCTKYMLVIIIHAQKQGEAFTSRHPGRALQVQDAKRRMMFLDFRKEKGLRGIQELVEMEWSPETQS